MRVVVDTNVVISGIFFSGPPYKILKAWNDGLIQMLVSEEILDEYFRVGRSLGLLHPLIDIERILELICINSEFVSVKDLPEPVSADSTDDKFISCAVHGRSKIIISGDRHLLQLTGFKGIEILKPRDFVTKYLGETRK